MILLYEFKMEYNTVEIACNITHAFGKGLSISIEINISSPKNGDEEGYRCSSAVGNNHLRAVIEMDSCKTSEEVAEELNVNYSAVVWHLHQIGKS